MKKYHKYLAFLLIGILTFSVLFQEIHIRLHQIHHHEHHCGTDHKAENDKSLNTETPRYTESEHHCLICDFQLTTKQWFKITTYECIYLEITESYFERKYIDLRVCTLPSKSSRAPPEYYFA